MKQIFCSYYYLALCLLLIPSLLSPAPSEPAETKQEDTPPAEQFFPTVRKNPAYQRTKRERLFTRDLKQWQSGKHRYQAYKRFKHNGTPVTLDEQAMKHAIIVRHNKNGLTGYLGIPIHFVSNQKHVRGTHIGTVDEEETQFGHVYIPSHVTKSTE